MVIKGKVTCRMLTAVLIPWDEEKPVTSVETDGGLEHLQELVGGYIQYVDVHDHALVCNEEGKVYGLPYNRRATEYVWAKVPSFAGHDILVGDVVVIGDDEGNSASVPASVLADFNLSG